MKQATFAILNTFLRLHEHACISVEFKWSPLLFDRNAIERLTFRLLRDLHITHKRQKRMNPRRRRVVATLKSNSC